MRIFIGLPVPDDIAQILTPMQNGIEGAKYSPKEIFHITLRFIGEMENHKIEALDNELAKIRYSNFELGLENADFFGSKNPHSIHIKTKHSQALNELALKCENACNRIGILPEGRKFMPHITLAYLPKIADLREVIDWKARFAIIKPIIWTTDRFYLYSSHQGKNGNYYQIEAEYPLNS